MISKRYSNNAFKNEIEKNTKDTSCSSLRSKANPNTSVYTDYLSFTTLIKFILITPKKRALTLNDFLRKDYCFFIQTVYNRSVAQDF